METYDMNRGIYEKGKLIKKLKDNSKNVMETKSPKIRDFKF